jgi:hypothetical protein
MARYATELVISGPVVHASRIRDTLPHVCLEHMFSGVGISDSPAAEHGEGGTCVDVGPSDNNSQSMGRVKGWER